MDAVSKRRLADTAQLATETAEVTAANVFNSLILSYVVLFFNRRQLWPRFATGVSAAELVRLDGFEAKRLQTILDATVSMGVLGRKRAVYHLTSLGRDLEQNRGFFTWAIGGYAPLLEAMDTFTTEPATDSLSYV